jgi:hypothetical protein
VKKGEEAMEILEAYDLTGSLRGAAALAGCDHKTVARLVAARDAAGGGLPVRARSRPLVDPFAEKIDELVDRSNAQIRADKAHGILVAMGYEGSSDHAQSGRGGQAALAEQARPPHQAVDPAARVVAAVGLWRWAGGRRRAGGVVLRVAGVVAVSGGGAVARQDDAERGDRAGPNAALPRPKLRRNNGADGP